MRTRQSRFALASSLTHRRPLLEMLEHRRLMTTTTTSWTASSISTLSGTYVAEVDMGGNGYIYGAPGMSVSVNGVVTDDAIVQWDSDLSDGLDSGWREVTYSIALGSPGSTSFDVDGAGTVGSSTGTSSSGAHLTQVAVRAGVMGMDMGMAWQGVVVYFYHGNSLIESVQLGGVSVDTTGAPTTDPAESVKVTTTDASNCDRVVVTGLVRLTAAADVYPAGADIFGQILIS